MRVCLFVYLFVWLVVCVVWLFVSVQVCSFASRCVCLVALRWIVVRCVVLLCVCLFCLVGCVCVFGGVVWLLGVVDCVCVRVYGLFVCVLCVCSLFSFLVRFLCFFFFFFLAWSFGSALVCLCVCLMCLFVCFSCLIV